MKVSIDKSAGFCWGVVRTIEIAEQALAKEGKLFCLGDIIHNSNEIERLKSKGLKTIKHEDLKNLSGATVLIRAHGEPPATYQIADKYGIRLVDATCPVVAKVQERIRKFYEDGYQVIIFGKKEHAEVIGLVGQTNGEAIVIKSLSEAKNVELKKKMVLFSQTTMDKQEFSTIKEYFCEKAKELIVDSIEDIALEFQAKYTICGQVSGREKHIREFSASNDIIIFVAGRHSSNGKVLYEIVKSVNPKVYFIESERELSKEWFEGIETVGITGATSTPQWLMERVKMKIDEIRNDKIYHNSLQPSLINVFINYLINI